MKKRRSNGYYERLIKEITEDEGISFEGTPYLCWSCVYKAVCARNSCIFTVEGAASLGEI